MTHESVPGAVAWARLPAPAGPTAPHGPIGPLGAVVTGRGLAVLAFEPWQPPAGVAEDPGHPLLRRVADELDRYWRDPRRRFTLPLDLHGTPFQRAVWQALTSIAPGSTCSYADIARRIGRPNAVRAVGTANGANPVAIVVPCHRVIGADGRLAGYAGGLDRKAWLLRHEAAQAELIA